ncbi:MAG TPA: hypothetical protein VHT34_11285 [Clostridia bacterium]|nr:hypothetical protein [Clostridia bacterium]
MRHFNGTASVGLRDKDTNKLIAVYPKKVEFSDTDVEKKVFDWYYTQSCSAENEMENYFVDVLNENEIKSLG